MKQDELYEPDWRSEQEICEWLGVSSTTLFRWRSSLKLAWTNINNRTVCYDKNQIVKILNSNSTYKYEGKKLAL